jgi:hypothetical protein
MMLVCGHHRLMTPTAESIQVGEPFSSSQLVTRSAIVPAEFGQSAIPDFSICQYVAAW